MLVMLGTSACQVVIGTIRSAVFTAVAGPKAVPSKPRR
jgi:hypothetical protein